jgi:iron(III) transport system ATP-binding protein
VSISFTGICHRYDASPVLSDVNIDIADGEVVCMLGPSGSGKSTLLRIAAGLERMQEGTIDVDGVRLADPKTSPPPEARSVGLVFQDHVLFPHLTVSQNIGFGLTNLDARTRTARIIDALARVGLSGIGERYPHTLSGGQQQRVALVRALVTEPRVMLLDEPFASVDAPLRHQLRSEARLALKDGGASSLIVTHDPEEALALADRIAVLVDGRVVQFGTSEDLWRNPLDRFVAESLTGAQAISGKASANGMVATEFGLLKPVIPLQPNAASVTVCIRGEAITLSDDTTHARATVRDVRFLGDHYQTTLIRGDSILASLSRVHPGVAPGDETGLTFASDGVHVYY